MPETIHVNCPAKVNLALSVGLPVEGDVRHPLASWFCAFDLFDDLWLSRLEDGESQYDIGFIDPSTPASESDEVPDRLLKAIDWPLDTDLIVNAHRLVETHVRLSLPTHMTLHKRIPAGAGLGGGSADAAGALVGLNRLHALGLSHDELDEIARELGSDVSFALSSVIGQPSALVLGYGEIIEPTVRHDQINLVLILPPLKCPTGKVYAAFDHWCMNRGRKDKQADLAKIARLIDTFRDEKDSQHLSALLFNDLSEPAFQIAGALRGIQQVIQSDLNRPVHVTGSGSTLFVIAKDEADADWIMNEIEDEFTYQLIKVKSL